MTRDDRSDDVHGDATRRTSRMPGAFTRQRFRVRYAERVSWRPLTPSGTTYETSGVGTLGGSKRHVSLCDASKWTFATSVHRNTGTTMSSSFRVVDVPPIERTTSRVDRSIRDMYFGGGAVRPSPQLRGLSTFHGDIQRSGGRPVCDLSGSANPGPAAGFTRSMSRTAQGLTATSATATDRGLHALGVHGDDRPVLGTPIGR